MRHSDYPTLAAAAWPVRAGADANSLAAAATLRNGVLALAGTLALVISAKTSVPFFPVPQTLQTLVVIVLGAAYGARLAAATLILYLAEGFIGLPVFAGAIAGPAYFLGPTAGFLVGFVVAAAFIGFFAERGFDRSIGKLLAVMAGGQVLIYAFGLAWLAHLFGVDKVWAYGAQNFYLADIVKTLLAAAIVPGLWKLMGMVRAG